MLGYKLGRDFSFASYPGILGEGCRSAHLRNQSAAIGMFLSPLIDTTLPRG